MKVTIVFEWHCYVRSERQAADGRIKSGCDVNQCEERKLQVVKFSHFRTQSFRRYGVQNYCFPRRSFQQSMIMQRESLITEQNRNESLANFKKLQNQMYYVFSLTLGVSGPTVFVLCSQYSVLLFYIKPTTI